MISCSIYRISTIFIVLLFLTAPVSSYNNNFVLQTVEQDEFSLSSYSGSYLLVEGMTTWCDSCKTEIAPLKQVDAELGHELTIIMVALDLETDTLQKVKDYRIENEIAFEIYVDFKSQLQDYYSIETYPSLFVFDTEGLLIKRWTGYTSASTMINEIGDALGIEPQYQGSELPALVKQLSQNIVFIMFLSAFVLLVIFRFSNKIVRTRR